MTSVTSLYIHWGRVQVTAQIQSARSRASGCGWHHLCVCVFVVIEGRVRVASTSALPRCNTSISGPLSVSRIRNEPKPNPNCSHDLWFQVSSSTPSAFSYIHISARLTCLSLFSLMVMVLLLPAGGWEGGYDWLYDSVGQKGAMCIERNAISTSIVFG